MNFITLFFSDDRKLDDWLSPILVKELRQGMRARVFVISFLLLQLFLIVLVLGNVAALTQHYYTGDAKGTNPPASAAGLLARPDKWLTTILSAMKVRVAG